MMNALRDQIGGLNPATEYVFQLASANEVGFSPNFQVVTLTLAPPPRIVSLVISAPNCALLLLCGTFAVGDVVDVNFDLPVRHPFSSGQVLSKQQVDALFSWSAPLAGNYSGMWLNSQQFQVCSPAFSRVCLNSKSGFVSFR